VSQHISATEPADAPSPFEQLVEFAPDAIVGVAEDGLIVLANHQAEVLFGRTRSELVGHPVDLLVPERFANHAAHRTGYFAKPSVRPMGANLALFGRRLDGSEFPAEISLSSVHTRQGQLALVVVRDVTERHTAEQARARLAAIVDSSNDAIIGHSVAGEITSWNRAAEQMYGYAAAEVAGQPLSILAAADAPEGNAWPAGDRLRHHETEQVCKDGTRIEVALTVSPVRDEHGEILGMATIARDISVQKRAERTFKGLLEFAPDAIVGVRADGRITLANRQAEALFGYSRDELLDMPVDRLVPGRYLNGHATHRAGYFADPGTRAMGAGVELHGRRKDGSEFPAEISLSSLEIDEGVVAVAAVRDISERAASERERALVEELNQTRRLESVGQLAGGIAHDFNNLLGVIINCAAFVAEELPPGSPAKADVEEIEQASRRGAALTRQLLIFSRREVVKTEVVDLNELTHGLEGFLRRALGEQVELEVVSADELWKVDVDRGQMEQVLVNLAVNGRDAMPSGGKLVIETGNVTLDEAYVSSHVDLAPGNYVRLTISDSGVGMSPDVVSRAFEPFYTTKPKGEGTGLGLATVYGIVAEARGRVALYSEPGVGTSVKIHLPASASTRHLPRTEAEVVAAGRGETLLIVEDEAAVRRVTERILQRAGYTVISAGGGSEALELLHSASIDAVLSDVIMPKMTGPELIARIRATKPDTKVIFMSGYSHKVLTHEALDGERTTMFIEKPFTADELKRKVRELLDAGPRR
jgi:PAS domain S-box-containing protein